MDEMEGEAWTAPGGGRAKVNLQPAPGLTYTATNSSADRPPEQEHSGL